MSDHVLDRLSAFLDSELPPAEAQEVDAHLAVCPECQRSLEDLTAVEALAGGLPRELSPDDHPLDLVARLRPQLSRKRRSAAPWWLAAAAAAVFVAFVPWILVGRHPEAAYSVPQPAAPPPLAQPAAPAAAREQDQGLAATAESKVQAAAGAPAKKAAVADNRVAADKPAMRREKTEAFGDERRQEQERAAPSGTGRLGFAPPPPAPKPGADAFAPGTASERAGSGSGSASNAAVAGKLDDASPRARRDEDAKAALAEEAVGAADTAAAPAEPDGTAQGAGAQKGYAGGRTASQAGAADTQARRKQAFASGEDARQARDRWSQVATRAANGAQAEHARVAAVEAAAEAYRLDRRQDDLTVLRKMTREYLDRPDASAAAYVRGLFADATGETP